MIMGWIWTGSLAISLFCSVIRGSGQALASAVLQGAQAGVELAVTVIVFWIYLNSRRSRKKRLHEFIQSHLDENSGVQSIKPPFPMLVLRLVRR